MTNKDPSKKFLDELTKGIEEDADRPHDITAADLERFSLLPQGDIGVLKLIVKTNNVKVSKGTECELIELRRTMGLVLLPGDDIPAPVDYEDISRDFWLEISETRLAAINALVSRRLSSENAKLLELAKSLIDSEPFEVGDRVMWKDGLKNSGFPLEGAEGVVIEVIDPPVVLRNNRDDMDRPTGGGRYDVVIASLGQRGSLVHYPEDSRRFKKVGKLN